MAFEVGSRLGHYDVTALIGEGGMGQVYQATDTKLNRQLGSGEKRDGIVKLTLRPAQCRDEHSPAPLPSASLSARNHQPCRLALPQILHELPGC